MIRLILMRHGTTLANEQGQWCGRGDSPLSPLAKVDLLQNREKVGKWQIEKYFVSPSRRAQESLRIVTSRKDKIEVVKALEEIDFGQLEGKSYDWLQANWPEEAQKMIKEGDLYCYPQGESLDMAHIRVQKWLRKWLESHPKGTYVICAHAGTIRSILSELLVGGPSLHWHFKIAPASLTVVSLSEGFPVIETLNWTGNSV